jgi:5-methylcytosine-specific restriction endonuclease McrA
MNKKRKKKISNALDRIPRKYSIEEVLPEVDFSKESKFKRIRKDFDGHPVLMCSDRLRTFSKKGIACCNCGIKGSYFYKEKHRNDEKFHLNFYGVNENNEEILMTKDHIVPKSKGGKNNIDNYQTMCVVCNGNKGAT